MMGVIYMLIYKIDVLTELKKNGYNTTRLRREKILGEASIQALRDNKMIGIKALDNICMILNKQPGELIEFIKVIWLDYIDSLYGK